MNATKALRFVAAAFNLSNYRIAQESGVREGVIGQIMNGVSTPNLKTVERIANGLSRINWRAKAIFLALLMADVPEDDIEPEIQPNIEYYAEWVEKVYRLFARYRLIDPMMENQLKVVLTTDPVALPQNLWRFLAESLLEDEKKGRR